MVVRTAHELLFPGGGRRANARFANEDWVMLDSGGRDFEDDAVVSSGAERFDG